MELKEREKVDAEAEYSFSVRHFEKVATDLYDLLKKKEEIESSARNQMSTGVSIFMLQQTENQLLRIQQGIVEYQRSTQIARSKMTEKQEQLITASVELKKYEKMKEQKFMEFQIEQKSIDSRQMDEISVQLFARR